MKKTFGALAAKAGSALMALVPVLVAGTAVADSDGYRPATLASRQKTFTTILENDKFAKTDKWYTSGGKLVVSLPEPQQKRYIISPLIDLNEWVFDQPGINRWELAIGQNIYEPADESLTTPDPKDRPYAGWLYVSAAAVAENRGQQNILEVQFGVVGPWSLAKEFQDVTHNLIGSNKALGWDHQLSNEPGLVIGLSRRWRSNPEPVLGSLKWDLVPFAGVAVGNVQTYANLGAQIRFGTGLRNDFGVPRIRPAGSAAVPLIRNDFGWYLFAGVEGWAVAHDIFLDGNTFEDSPSVEKKPLVGEVNFGFVAYVPSGRLNLTFVKRSKEFTDQPEAFDYGSASFTFKF